MRARQPLRVFSTVQSGDGVTADAFVRVEPEGVMVDCGAA
jgi:hypothetical protein